MTSIASVISSLRLATSLVKKTIPSLRLKKASKSQLMDKESKYDAILKFIEEKDDTQIILLKNKQVLQWLYDDPSFLKLDDMKNKTHDRKLLKKKEDEWGREVTKTKRPDLNLDKQWTGVFGESIVKELYILKGCDVKKPIKIKGFQPDLETETDILESKAETFYTEGTAGEKILGVPFKYADVPSLYSKSLKIVCLGGAEKACREQYGNLGTLKCTPQKKILLDAFKANRIEYIGATDILDSLINL